MVRSARFHLLGICISVLLMTLSSSAWAAKVKKVAGKKVLVELDGEPAKAGQIFVVFDPAGKRRGVIKISQIKGNQATAILGKGKAEPGWEIKASTASAKNKPATRASKSTAARKGTEESRPAGSQYWGIMGGYAMDSLKVKIDNDANNTNETSVSLDGSAFSLKGVFDYQLFSDIWFRGMFGLEGLSAKGPTQVGCQNKTCDANIYYLGADFWGRYVLPAGDFKPWVGAAFSLMFPASKKSTALEESSITNTSAISLGAGADWMMSPTMIIPFQLEYSILPKSETVEATVIAFRAGLIFPF